ncbi:MAG: hypothetical protein U0Y10_20055 [Spirosomataceae bacterium]
MNDFRQIDKQLSDLALQLERLVEEHRAQKYKVRALERQNSQLEAENQQLQLQVKQLQKNQAKFQEYFHNSDKITKIVSNKLKETDHLAELKTQVDTYIREIERCIQYLNQ